MLPLGIEELETETKNNIELFGDTVMLSPSL